MANQADHPVTMLCSVLGISTSGFYAWRVRGPSERAKRDAELTEKIRGFHRASRQTYGSPRIHRDLREDGDRLGRKRVARLMKADGLRGVCRRKKVRTTLRSKEARPAPDLVNRNFTAGRPNALWVADITYVPTWSGFLFLAVVLDVFSRRVVGWSMRGNLRKELVLEALDMAIDQRRPEKVIHHSDQGSQYTSIAFGKRCQDAGIDMSMGSVGDCYDNALCESFFATFECELLDRSDFRSHSEARSAIFQFLESFYNRQRRHSALGYLSPLRFEMAYEAARGERSCGDTCGKDAEILRRNLPRNQHQTTATLESQA